MLFKVRTVLLNWIVETCKQGHVCFPEKVPN
jgi:hypothetical protein